MCAQNPGATRGRGGFAAEAHAERVRRLAPRPVMISQPQVAGNRGSGLPSRKMSAISSLTVRWRIID